MTQLSDDCFAFGGDLMKSADALSLIEARLHAVTKTEEIPLNQSLGRILAQDVQARCHVPPHDNAAVDGFAVYFSDLGPEETVLPVRGRVAAGHPLATSPQPGAAIRIFTGAPMPKAGDGSGPDTVVMEEDCQFTDHRDEAVRIPPGLTQGANRRFAGEDIQAGTIILPRGRRLGPADLGLAASVGMDKVPVRRALRVAVFSTGDEICRPPQSLRPGQVYDANTATLTGLLQSLGGQVHDLGIIGDEPKIIKECLQSASQDNDLIISSGGVSAGQEDHIRDVVNTLGNLYFWRLAVRPGRPLAMGQVGRVPFIGLPGNPVATAVTFMIFARPAIHILSGATMRPVKRFPIEAGFDYHKKKGRREWLRGRLITEPDKPTRVVKFERDGAGILSSMVESDGLIELDEERTKVTIGDGVHFIPFSEFLW